MSCAGIEDAEEEQEAGVLSEEPEVSQRRVVQQHQSVPPHPVDDGAMKTGDVLMVAGWVGALLALLVGGYFGAKKLMASEMIPKIQKVWLLST